mmetsp:Transcript_1077/g.4004  ORF Transcript_1077/g.4004 Transcript_1077/m.4004 type:complete len:229 (+) Transcript_1077:506-1192(+)
MYRNMPARMEAVDSFQYHSSESSVNQITGTLPARTSGSVALASAHSTKSSSASGDVSHHASSSPRLACSAANLAPDASSSSGDVFAGFPGSPAGSSTDLPRPDAERARAVAMSASLPMTSDVVTSARVQSRRPTPGSNAPTARSSRSSDACFTAYINPALPASSPTNSRTHQSYLGPQAISKFIFQTKGTPFRAHSIARRRFSRILSSVSAFALSPKMTTPGLLYGSM